MRCVIFGASGDIGNCIAHGLVEQEWEVIGASTHTLEDAAYTQYIADVRDSSRIRQVFEKTGHIDALIYCAGVGLASPAVDTFYDDYVNVFEVNLFGLCEAVKHAVEQMSKGGRIIAVSSMAGVLPIPFNAFYSASKAAINAYMAALDCELVPKNIRALTVLPGGVRTEFSRKRKKYSSLDADFHDPLQCAINEITEDEQGGIIPERVAHAVIKLLSDPNPALVTAVAGSKVYYALEKLLPKNLVHSILTNKYTH